MTLILPFQKPYENIKLFLRRHWSILFFIYLGFGALILAGILAYYFLTKSFHLSGNFLNLSLFLLFFYLLIIWQILFKVLTDFYLDAWIATDHRILDIHQKGLFKRDISELRLSKIQDVTVKIEGMLPTFLNYGDVVIQTAGAVQEFKFEQVANPQEVKSKILELHDEYIKEHKEGVEIHQ